MVDIMNRRSMGFMQVDPIQLHSQNTLMNDYRQNKEEIMKFFEYLPFTDLNQRMKDLGGYNFEREKLTQVLHTMNEKWDAPQSTFYNIERLKKENSVVI